MRIVHELHNDAQTTVTGHVYATRADKPNVWPGMRFEALAAWTCPVTGQEEAIEIEGDLDKFRRMLRDWLAQLDFIEDEERKLFASERRPDPSVGTVAALAADIRAAGGALPYPGTAADAVAEPRPAGHNAGHNPSGSGS